MKLISSIRVQGFRSIADEGLEYLGGHTVFTGKNSSGKSNVLRALNLFFNGETSPGIPVDFDVDFHFRPTRRQKKIIQITVGFSLPEGFRFRRELEPLQRLGPNFLVRKTWALSRQRRPEESVALLVGDQIVEGGDRLAYDFLSLIVFRYIPNRTVPSELLRDESQSIAAVIFKRLRESAQAADVLRGLSESAGRILQSTASALSESGAPISNPNIATADSLGGMLRMSGFQARGLNGSTIRDEDWGAGHQAFFLLHLLRDIDTDYSRQFGWRQATVWAVEEPESGLHHDLQTRLSKKLIEWTSDENRRLQVFTTTHSPVVAMSGDCGYWTEVGETSSVLRPMNTQELVRAAEEHGVSTYLHPILSYPFNPVVLVEGDNDELVLNYVASVVGRSIIKFVTLPTMQDGESSGVDSLISYIKKNSRLLSRRPADCPMIVLVDWEVSDQKLVALRSAYGVDAERYVVRANPANCSTILGSTFLGLERFYCPRVIRASHEAGECAVAFPQGDAAWSIERGQLMQAKGRWAQRLLKIRDVNRLAPLIRVVEQAYEAATSRADQQLSLL
ncbi:MAG TPA: AAA family ATPase [Dokdonella sp.]|uniref:ATP-dependent nuclease n=1 Tax=Dokdonella sp. TaxID=2291710 RepID=UPI002C560D4D|nr:AAA family ATPase [Dokdonella sp.]HUD42699.1 AAA family ATPase [Dokdonella sp.]